MTTATKLLHLNFACGPTVWPDFENSDVNGQGDRMVDLEDRPLPYPDGCAELILISHGLKMSHYGAELHPDLPALFAEFHRILAPGGWLRIDDNPFRIWRETDDLDPGEAAREATRGFPPEHALHRDDLNTMLLAAGFRSVTELPPSTTTIPGDDQTRAAIVGNHGQHLSFAVEAQGVIFDFDDCHETNHRLDLLQRLRDANPAFRCTLFAPPALGTDAFWDSLPDWVELAVHGWDHGGPACTDAREAEHWTYEQAIDVLLSAPARFARGFKAPGWQISEGTYDALFELDWWVADHYENDARRTKGLLTHRLSETASSGRDRDHWHGHIGNVCGNGIEETFPLLLARVRDARSFEFIGESVVPWFGFAHGGIVTHPSEATVHVGETARPA